MDEKTQEQKKYTLGEVATQTDIVIVSPDGKTMTMQQALVEILNKQEESLRFLKG